MSTFLIANKDSDKLETIVFDGEGGTESVAVFTDFKKADQYIRDANWTDQYTVATLQPIDFMEWLIHCHRSGIQLMVTDPLRSDQEAGRKLSTLNIEAHLEHAGEHIELVADPEF